MKILIALCLIAVGISSVIAAKKEASIAEATSFCEREVPTYCIATTCPQFCNALRTTRAKTNCNSGCTKDNRCKLKPNVGNDSRDNGPLDAQNRDQLWACIAEQRDPNNTKTGRRPTPWKEMRTDSFQRATRP